MLVRASRYSIAPWHQVVGRRGVSVVRQDARSPYAIILGDIFFQWIDIVWGTPIFSEFTLYNLIYQYCQELIDWLIDVTIYHPIRPMVCPARLLTHYSSWTSHPDSRNEKLRSDQSEGSLERLWHFFDLIAFGGEATTWDKYVMPTPLWGAEKKSKEITPRHQIRTIHL